MCCTTQYVATKFREDKIMDDIKRALLGDKEAAERLTDAGVLLPCPF